MMTYDYSIEKKLTRVYVALAMTRELAKREIFQNETSHSVLSFIDVASKTLDDLWQELWKESSSEMYQLEDRVCLLEDTTELEMLM